MWLPLFLPSPALPTSYNISTAKHLKSSCVLTSLGPFNSLFGLVLSLEGKKAGGRSSEVMKTRSDVLPTPTPMLQHPPARCRGGSLILRGEWGRGRHGSGEVASWVLCARALAEVGLASFSDRCVSRRPGRVPTPALAVRSAGDLNEGGCGSVHLGC